jgi:hypothetical protein
MKQEEEAAVGWPLYASGGFRKASHICQLIGEHQASHICPLIEENQDPISIAYFLFPIYKQDDRLKRKGSMFRWEHSAPHLQVIERSM